MPSKQKKFVQMPAVRTQFGMRIDRFLINAYYKPTHFATTGFHYGQQRKTNGAYKQTGMRFAPPFFPHIMLLHSVFFWVISSSLNPQNQEGDYVYVLFSYATG